MWASNSYDMEVLLKVLIRYQSSFEGMLTAMMWALAHTVPTEGRLTVAKGLRECAFTLSFYYKHSISCIERGGEGGGLL